MTRNAKALTTGRRTNVGNENARLVAENTRLKRALSETEKARDAALSDVGDLRATINGLREKLDAAKAEAA